jgi:hypothetical protein
VPDRTKEPTIDDRQRQTKGKSLKSEQRRQRLADQLRRNLKRRKAAAHDGREESAEAKPREPADSGGEDGAP